MGFLGGFFGKKTEQPTQPGSGGGIETGIPAGAPPTQQLNPNTLGGLMPATPVIEKPASRDIEETGTWAAAKSALDAERVTAAASSAGIVPPGANENLDMTTGMTPPLSIYGAPSPAAIEGSPSAPKFNEPVAEDAPAEPLSAPAAEVAETNIAGTEHPAETVAEPEVPVIEPVTETPAHIETPEAPTPPPFSMDALTTPQTETPTLSAESTDGQGNPTIPDVTEQPTATVTTEPEPVAEATPTEPATTEPVVAPEPTTPASNEPIEPVAEIPAVKPATDGNNGLEPLGGNTTTDQPAAAEPNQTSPVIASDNEAIPETKPAEPAPTVEVAEQIPNNVVPFPVPVTPAVDVPASEPTTEVAQTETTPEPAELPQAA